MDDNMATGSSEIQPQSNQPPKGKQGNGQSFVPETPVHVPSTLRTGGTQGNPEPLTAGEADNVTPIPRPRISKEELAALDEYEKLMTTKGTHPETKTRSPSPWS